MKYRINRRTGDRISEIGLGSACLCDADMGEAVRALRAAYDGGIYYFDLGAGNGRNLLLGERNELRNRDMHIRGVLANRAFKLENRILECLTA